MRNLVLVLGLLLPVISSCQEQPLSNRKTATYYRDKSTSQFVAGGILLGAGTVLFLVGNNMQRHATGFDFSGTGVAGVGLLAAGGSVPLLIAAFHNRNKSRQLAVQFKFETNLSSTVFDQVLAAFPAVNLHVRL